MNGRRLAVLSLLLAPLLWLWPCVFGDRTFVPYDVAQFPPASLTLSPAQLAAAQDGANFDVTEVPVWFLPELRFARDELRAGRLPTWNPHARGGAPLHAHGLIGLCYPPNWLALFADAPASRLGLVAWINLALGGLLAFGLLRATGLGVLPAWFGALVFELSGPMATNAFFWMRLGSYIWLPGVLWAVLATTNAERLRPRHVAGLGSAFALTWLAGFPPFAATTTLLGGAFAAWLCLARARAAGFAAARATALRLLAGFALGGCLALPQVLPSLQYFPESARPTHPAWRDIANQTYEAHGLLGYLLPDAFSHPTAVATAPYGERNVLSLVLTTHRDDDGKAVLPNFNYTEYAVFVGQLALLLAFAGIGRGRGHHRGFALTAWLLCAGLALFVPGCRLLFHLPLVENVWPTRWLAPATLFVAWLAAIGVQRVQAAKRALPLALAGLAAALAVTLARFAGKPAQWHAEDRTWAVTQLAAKYRVSPETVLTHVGASPENDLFAAAFARLAEQGALAAYWLAGAAVWFALLAFANGTRQRHWLLLAAGAVSAVQLALHGGSILHGTCRTSRADPAVHAFLRERAAAAAATGGFMIARGDTETELPSMLPPGQLLVPGLRDLQFYSHFDGRSLQPIERLLGSHVGTIHAGKGYLARTLPHTVPSPAHQQLLAADASVPADHVACHPFEHPLLDLLGVRYVLSLGADPDGPHGPRGKEPLPHTGTPVTIPGAPAGFFVQERTTALPRAFAVDDVRPAATDADIVRALLALDFAPQRVAHALAADLPAPLPKAAAADAQRRAVTFATDLPAHIELDVAAGAQPWLLLTDTFLSGWTATIDGQPAPILRGDHAFRLLRLPEHTCRVAFTYRAPGMVAGSALALFATLAWLVWAFATARRKH